MFPSETVIRRLAITTGALAIISVALAPVAGAFAAPSGVDGRIGLLAQTSVPTDAPDELPDDDEPATDEEPEEGGRDQPRGDLEAPPDGIGVIDVIEVSGLVDPVIVDFVGNAIAAAGADEEVVALVIQLNSSGSVVGAGTLDELATAIGSSAIPVAVWIGPSGARAHGGAARIAEAAVVSGIAPGGSVEVDVGRAVVAASSPTQRVGADDAVAGGVIDLDSPTLGDFVVDLDGLVLDGVELNTAVVRDTDDGPRLEPTVIVRFAKLGLLARLMHTVASPQVAYLLLAVGMVLLLFELFTGGVGIAGMTGAVSLCLSAYGFAVLPTRPAALVLMGLAAFGFGVDIQTGVPRVWTAVATAAFLAGSLSLYDGISLSWLTLVVGVAGTLLMTVNAIPAVVRSRYSTPTIGREWMVGETAEVVRDVDPDGQVRVQGALWRARTNRATPLAAGTTARVAGLSGVVLEVEPFEGAARDYRERARSTAPPESGN